VTTPKRSTDLRPNGSVSSAPCRRRTRSLHRPQWGRTWWAYFGRDRKLNLAIARRAGALVAVAPLCTRRRGRESASASSSAPRRGTSEASSSQGTTTPLQPAFVRVVLDDDGWDFLDLWGIVAGRRPRRALSGALAASGVPHEIVPMTLNPVLDLRSDTWAASASRSMLRDLARQRRALERQGTFVLRIEVRNPVEHFKSLLVFAGPRVSVGNYEILRAGVGRSGPVRRRDQQAPSRLPGRAFELLDLAVHRDGFQPEFLFAIVFRYAQEAGNRFFFLASARQKISQHVESGEIVIIVLDDLTILFDGGADLSLCQEFLSGFYTLAFSKAIRSIMYH